MDPRHQHRRRQQGKKNSNLLIQVLAISDNSDHISFKKKKSANPKGGEGGSPNFFPAFFNLVLPY
jgi:hypothetical protein